MHMKNYFEKVSLRQYRSCFNDEVEKDDVHESEYNGIILPKRATSGSAGYDFYLPYDISLYPDQTITIATGVRVVLEHSLFLAIVPRSSLGFKYGLRLRNTVGIIDSDYSHAQNEGHIMVKLTTEEPVTLKAGDRFVQGIILSHGFTDNDQIFWDRVGGFGSTGN